MNAYEEWRGRVFVLYENALANLTFWLYFYKSAFQKLDNDKYYCSIAIDWNSIVNAKEPRVYFYIGSKKFEFDFVRYYV